MFQKFWIALQIFPLTKLTPLLLQAMCDPAEQNATLHQFVCAEAAAMKTAKVMANLKLIFNFLNDFSQRSKLKFCQKIFLRLNLYENVVFDIK